ncbi:MAG TPA: TAT-variant-translocated molybdopterin oxidoreductase, partial [Terriglobales bacterium]|nr:TAT-variant-translocated molybdopterin oxidoreductase [Terriglobales bacterium]
MDKKNNSIRGAGEICPGKRKSLDLHEVRAQLERTRGPEYWRSLEELAGSAEFRQMMQREFPKGASEWVDEVSRRGFLKLMGASLALAGMTGCTKLPLEPIVPYVRQPEQIVPGRPMFYASAFTLSGYATPILVESHLGRPTKIEGNPEHPVSQGGTDVFAQASLLDLYDPDRSQTVTYLGDVRSSAAFLEAIRGLLNVQKGLQGAGIRILTQTISSPTLGDQMRNLLKIYPQAKWHVYEPVNRDNVYSGAQMAFGQPVETQYRLENADVVVSLDADFLYAGFPGFTRCARDYAKRRNPDGNMNRLYVVESVPSSTGVKADNRLPLRAAEVEAFTAALGQFLGVKVQTNVAGLHGEAANFGLSLVKDLQAHRGSSAIIPGEYQSPAVHAWAHALNQMLGNVGRTVFYTDPVNANPINQTDSLGDLVNDMRSGKVDILIILGGNPAYDAPADLNFADALKNTKIPMRVHLGLYQNETAELCQWHVNEAHYLEAWSDTRAYDGTVSIVQPLIEPLYSGRSAHEFVSLLAGQGESRGYDLVRAYWQKQHAGADFESFWRKSVHDGWIEGTTYQAKQVTLKTSTFPASNLTDGGVTLNFRRDPSIYDGRFSNNGWLQELPKPLTKMTWDNPVLIGPAMAERLHLQSEDVIELQIQGKKIEAPVWIQAGHPDNSVTAFLGYGRRRAGRAGTGAGVDVNPLRMSASPWFASGLQIRATGGKYKLATTQG